MNKYLLLLLAAGSLLLPGCKTTESYFLHRIDKGIILEGGYRATGLVIKTPSSQSVDAGHITLGHEVGWGIMSAIPLGEHDALYYEHLENANLAGQTTQQGAAKAEGQTRIKVDKRGYLAP